MADDLRRFLEKWPYDPEEPIRAVHGRDGRRKLQLRLPLGVEQYELDGRPDGARPRGCTSLLVFWEGRLRTFRRRRGSDAGFALPDDACRDLRDEALLYYSRYILLFQLGEYGRCARDTARNLRCLDLIRRYGRAGETWDSLEHYRPYIVRMNRASRALLAMQRNQYDIALGELRAGARTIEELPAEDEMGLKFEKKRSLAFLKELEREIRRVRPLSPRERLEKKLRKAVRRENYELAARLRDRIAELRREHAPSQD